MSKKSEIIENIEGNGGLDMSHIDSIIKGSRTIISASTRHKYISNLVKNQFCCSGKTANLVADHYCY